MESPSGRQVFEILAREHADMLVSYLRSLVRGEETVDDLFQETMLTAWRRLDDYDRERPFAPWLRGIASRLVLRQRDQSARDLLTCDLQVLEALEDRHQALARKSDSFRDSVDRLLNCLRRLPDKLRSVIELAYQSGLGFKQVAKELDCSEEAAKKRAQRGRQLLADCLLETELES
ncbi:MAG: RNA polymerase sigma factor [Planctomycetota bacterium]|jgi:RNA polymerase sigma-70 factor (ECF subfamily)